jgi:hypothetical protein
MVYQVGNPWIFEGKIFFPETGIPMRKSARKSRLFAVALPDPLTVLMVMQKSFTIGPVCTPAPIAGEGDSSDIVAP